MREIGDRKRERGKQCVCVGGGKRLSNKFGRFMKIK